MNLKFKGDIFEKEKVVSKAQTKEFDLPLVNAKSGDNGIMYYGRSSEFEFEEMTIDIVNDGAISTGDVYPQINRTGVLYNAYLIKPKFKATVSNLYFFSTAIKKSIKLKFSYENKAGWEKVKNEYIQLPTKEGEIDFEFMELFVAELEAQRVAELEAYLTVTGLKNYQLTKEEKLALKELDTIEWKEYNLEKLFGKATRGKRLKSADRVSGNLIFVTAGETDEGVSAYIGNDVEIFHKNTITIDMFGSAKYRNYNYGADDHIAVVHTEDINNKAAIFITTSIHKVSYNGQFDYGRNFYAKDADKLNIQLPIKNGEINFKYMEILISAIQKLVIKDVVVYAEKKIKATKEVINR